MAHLINNLYCWNHGGNGYLAVRRNVAHLVNFLYCMKHGATGDFPVFPEWAWPIGWWAWSPALTLMGGHIFLHHV